jgi:hypothetical protein
LLTFFQPDVDRLTHSEFAVREAAEARLACWSDLAWPLLEQPGRDPEQRRRLRRLREHAWGRGEPPLTMLVPTENNEWYTPENTATYGRRCPDPSYWLAYRHVNPFSHSRQVTDILRRRLVVTYCLRCKRDWTFHEWHTNTEASDATELLIHDLRRVGAPPVLVRCLRFYLHEQNEWVLVTKK